MIHGQSCAVALIGVGSRRCIPVADLHHISLDSPVRQFLTTHAVGKEQATRTSCSLLELGTDAITSHKIGEYVVGAHEVRQVVSPCFKLLLALAIAVFGTLWSPRMAVATCSPLCGFIPDLTGCGSIACSAGGCPTTQGPLFVPVATCGISTRTLFVEAWSCSGGSCVTPSSVTVWGSQTQNGTYTLVGSLTQMISCSGSGDAWVGSFCFNSSEVKPKYIKITASDGCGIEDMYARYCCDCE